MGLGFWDSGILFLGLWDSTLQLREDIPGWCEIPYLSPVTGYPGSKTHTLARAAPAKSGHTRAQMLSPLMADRYIVYNSMPCLHIHY